MTDGNVKILIVDDKPEKVLALEAVLEDPGQTIVRAYSGREALRCLLNDEFAVILLDVNMPGMDGFETAQLIRQRPSTEHLPIIFVTAFGDEDHAARGYRLGAVDYIQTPVVSEVLKTKVSVFVDLYSKTRQLQEQAEGQRHRAAQLQKLAGASLAINSALSVETMLQTVTDTARHLVGSHQAITLYVVDSTVREKAPRTRSFTSFSDKYSEWRDRRLDLDAIATTVVARSQAATRMTESELREHADWRIVSSAAIPPVHGGMLVAPLVSRTGGNLGLIYLCDRYDGPFTHDDEAILTQLAQMASIAIENAILAEEREANRIKDEFLSTLSHELRTPLNAILGWTQLLQVGGAAEDAGQIAHAVQVIERNAKAQARLVEDLLDVSRVANGKLRLNARPMNFSSVVTAAVDAVRPVAEQKQLTLRCNNAAADDDQIHGDGDRLQQVLSNLLNNAMKFTPAGGSIEVCLDRCRSESGEALRLRVIDTGRGISPSFLPYVFDRFRQADSTSTRSHGGLGIGLTIVRRIVELHGGSAQADSPGEGKGATFTVMLPITAAAVGASSSESSPAAQLRTAGETAPQAAVSLAGIHVVVVDDEPDARDVIARILTAAGADVASAGSVSEALSVISHRRPDVLVSDIAMPEQDGYDLVRMLAERPAEPGLPAIPAVALTAYAREEDRNRALAAGFREHLPKPVDPAEIVRAVARLAAEPSTARQPQLK